MSRKPRIELFWVVPSVLVAFLIGILIGFWAYLYSFGTLQLDNKVGIYVDPSQIVSLLVSIILAVWVLRGLGKKDESEKAEKELLGRLLVEFREDFETSIKGFIVKRDIEYQEVAARLKRFRMRMEMLLTLGEDHGFFNKGLKTSVELKKEAGEMLRLFTDTPVKANAADAPLSVVKGRLTIKRERVDEIAQTIYKIQKIIFELIVEVNRV